MSLQRKFMRYQARLLLRLQPGDAGYNGWVLALREYREAVEECLRLVAGVQDFLDTPASESSSDGDSEEDSDEEPKAPVRADVKAVADIVVSWPLRASIL